MNTKVRIKKFINELDGRVKVTIVGTGIHNWGQQLTSQYNLLYAVSLGASSIELGLLNAIAGAISSLVSIPLGWATEKYSVRRVIILGYACTALASILFIMAGTWWMLIPAFVLLNRLVRIMPLTDIIFISVTDPEKRARVMSLSRVVWGFFNVFAPLTGGLIVVYFGGINTQGIRPLYYIQLVLMLFVFLFMAKMLRPLPINVDRVEIDTDSKFSDILQDYWDFFKGEKWIKRWMVLRVIRQFGMNIAMPFIPLWLVSVKGATPQILGLMGTVGVLVSLFLQIPTGMLSDRIGRKKTYFLLRPFVYLGTILMILITEPNYLVLVGFFGIVALGGVGGGGVGMVSNTPLMTMFWETIPSEKRGRGFGIEGLINLMAIPASILGGFLWQNGFMIEVLLLPILLELLLVMPILATIPDTFVKSLTSAP